MGSDMLTATDCFIRALLLDLQYAAAWFGLGNQAGGVVAGESLSSQECFERALLFNPQFTAAWYKLGFEGGGVVFGRLHSEQECYERAALSENPNLLDRDSGAGGIIEWGRRRASTCHTGAQLDSAQPSKQFTGTTTGTCAGHPDKFEAAVCNRCLAEDCDDHAAAVGEVGEHQMYGEWEHCASQLPPALDGCGE